MEELFAKYTLKYLKSIKEWWSDKDVQIPEVHQESNSYFVSNADQMNSVYEIRDSIFGGDQLSGEAYNAFLNKNEFAITLLSFDTPNKKVLTKDWAYYSIIPISKDTYDSFISNNKEHTEVIQESLSWQEALAEEKVYLYLVGIVVRQGLWNKKLKSAHALIDLAEFISTIFDILTIDRIGGLCGFPSRAEGLNLFERRTHAFKYTGHCKSDDGIQKIYVCENTGIKVLRSELQEMRSSPKFDHYKEAVHWKDKLLFIETLDQN